MSSHYRAKIFTSACRRLCDIAGNRSISLFVRDRDHPAETCNVFINLPLLACPTGLIPGRGERLLIAVELLSVSYQNVFL